MSFQYIDQCFGVTKDSTYRQIFLVIPAQIIPILFLRILLHSVTLLIHRAFSKGDPIKLSNPPMHAPALSCHADARKAIH